MSDQQDPKSSNDDAGASTGETARRPLGTGKPLARKPKKNEADAGAVPAAAPAATAAPSAEPDPAQSVGQGVIAKGAEGFSKAKKAGIAGVAAFGVMSLLGIVYMKTTNTGALGNAVMGSSSANGASALGDAPCRDTGDKATPLVVDWESNDRMDVEAGMKHGLVVVQYSCSAFKVLPDCSLEGKYGYVGVTLKEDVVQISSADELKANLPKSGSGKDSATLLNEMGRGATLDIATALVGKFRATRIGANKSELKGKCTGATHYVRGASVGAFALDTGSTGKVRTAAEMFGASSQLNSTASKIKKARDGSIEACRASDPDSPKAPAQCQGMVRLEMVPIEGAETGPAGSAAGRTAAYHAELLDNPASGSTGGCPKGMVYADDHCVSAAKAKAYQCKPNDGAECIAQCEKGDENSCAFAAQLLYDGNPDFPDNPSKALEYYKKGCDGGNQTACGEYGYYLRNGILGGKKDGARAAALMKQSAESGDPMGMMRYSSLFGSNYQGHRVAGYPWPLPADPKQEMMWKNRACEAGSGYACMFVGGLHRNGTGVAKDEKKAFEYMKRGCDGGDPTACTWVAMALITGSDLPKDPEKGKRMLEERCSGATKDWGNCYTLGSLQLTDPLFAADHAKGWPNVKDACAHGVGAACKWLAGWYRVGGASRKGMEAIPKDLVEARKLAQRGCDLAREATSNTCLLLSQMLQAGEGGPKDDTQTEALIEKGCFFGDPEACKEYFKAHPAND